MSLPNNFRKMKPEEKQATLVEMDYLTSEEQSFLNEEGLSLASAHHLIENVIGVGSLPIGLLPSLVVEGKEYLVPLMTEEPSVVAAASFGAKCLNRSGGFTVVEANRAMIGQIVFDQVDDVQRLKEQIQALAAEFSTIAKAAYPSIVERGGGYRSYAIDLYPEVHMLSLKIVVDTKDAMGANMLNTILEKVTLFLKKQLDSVDILMSILSNHAIESIVKVRGRVAVADLTKGAYQGEQVAKRIVRASVLAQTDVYRAVTHNKGIMNGMEAVALATGNDTRALEASAHAYAARSGQYKGLTTWQLSADEKTLEGTIEVPLALATVGGGTSVLPHAKVARALLQVTSAAELGTVVASVGLAQNLAALRALVSEGIQQGHMSLHYQTLAVTVGAEADEIPAVVAALKERSLVNTQVAQEVLKDLRKKSAVERLQ